jgi:hypothetical protein
MTIQIPVSNQNVTLLSSNGPAIQTASVNVPPLAPGSNNQLTVTATGIQTWEAFYPGTATVPANVFLQMEQGVTIDTGRPDQYVLQYIGWTNAGTNDLQITFRIMRIDVLYDKSPPPDVGWEQDLLVNVLLLTQGIQTG